eukprot:scaffold189358_cov14-Tisochrysis_lutea.AAC.1
MHAFTQQSRTPPQAHLLPCMHAGGQSKSLLTQPSVWYVAAAEMPRLATPEGAAPAALLSEEKIEELRNRCEGILANEAAAFERELKRRNLADYKWIMQVKRSGTTSDKVAAITLQVQGRACSAACSGCRAVTN